MSPEQIYKHTDRTEEEIIDDLPTEPVDTSDAKKEMDDLLNEIEEVLEDNAEKYVKSFQQRNGQ